MIFYHNSVTHEPTLVAKKIRKNFRKSPRPNLEGQAQRQMLVTSSSCNNRSVTDPTVNRSDTDPHQSISY